jgi:ribosomal protein S19
MKINYFSENLWRKIFLYKKNPIFKTSEKFVYSRSSSVPKILINYSVYIYSGKIWNTRFLNKWMIGHKFGEFTWNKKIAMYKAKQLKKKK